MELLKKHYHKDLLKLYRKALTSISNINLVSLQVAPEARFKANEFSFEITIFNQCGGNRSFPIYDFWDLEKNSKIVDDVINLIKTDNFKQVKEYQSVY